MFFKNKIKRVIDVEKIEEERKESEPLQIEKGDLKAMIIAAFLVFSPVVLVLAGVVFLLYLLFSR